MGALLPPPGDDEQRVVDSHAQPDQGDQELHDDADRREMGQAADDEEGRRDGDHGHEQRDDGDEAGEDEGQDGQGADTAERGLGEGTHALAGSARLQLTEAGDAGVPSGRGGGGGGGGDRRSDAVSHPVLLRGVHQAEGGAAVGGGEVGVAGVLLVDDPCPGNGGRGRRQDPVGRSRRSGLAGGGGDGDDRRRAHGVVKGLDLAVSDKGGLVGHLELSRQPFGGRPEGGCSDQGHDEPCQHDPAAMAEDEGGQSVHGSDDPWPEGPLASAPGWFRVSDVRRMGWSSPPPQAVDQGSVRRSRASVANGRTG